MVYSLKQTLYFNKTEKSNISLISVTMLRITASSYYVNLRGHYVYSRDSYPKGQLVLNGVRRGWTFDLIFPSLRPRPYQRGREWREGDKKVRRKGCGSFIT